MKYLGIDYGSKRIGVAMSDDGGNMAFPKAVIPNNRHLMVELSNLIKNHKIEKVIVGESKDFNMEDNPIFKDARFFASELARETGVSVEFEPEYLTSHQAGRTNFELSGGNAMLDASAAAIILQSFLDKVRSRSN